MVHVSIEQLKLDCILDVKVGEDDRDSIASREFAADCQERLARRLEYHCDWRVNHRIYHVAILC